MGKFINKVSIILYCSRKAGSPGFPFPQIPVRRASCMQRAMQLLRACMNGAEALPLAVALYANRARPEGATLSIQRCSRCCIAYREPCSRDTGWSRSAVNSETVLGAKHASAACWVRLVVGRQPAKLFG